MFKNKNIKILLFIIVFIAIVGFVVIRYLDNKASSANNKQSTTSLQSKLEPSSNGNNLATNKPSSTSSTTPATLIYPTGSFVSNHNPVLNNPNLDSEQSTCNTTPGASCNIFFSNGSTSYSLGSKIVGSDGTANWSWTPQTVGLTAGSWKITATATLNNKSLSASDQLPINIQ